MLTRTAWRTPGAGSLDRLKLVEEPLAEPATGEARVRVAAVGLNFADIFALLGLYSATPKGSFVPGLEFAGTIEAIPGGKRNAPLKEGDRVLGVKRFGAYASHLNVKTDYLRKLPRGYSFAQGAALPAQGLTAYYALFELGNLKKGDTVLVHSAAGGVGLIALDMIKRTGAHAIGTVGHESKLHHLRELAGLSPNHMLVRDRKRFPTDLDQRLKAVGRKGLDLVLDSIAGPYFYPAFERLLPAGRHVLFGAADFMPAGSRPNYLRLGWQYVRRPRLDPVQMISENRSVLAFNLIWMWDRVELFARFYDAMLRLKPHAPHVGHQYPFNQTPSALRFFQSGRSIGKVVLEL